MCGAADPWCSCRATASPLRERRLLSSADDSNRTVAVAVLADVMSQSKLSCPDLAERSILPGFALMVNAVPYPFRSANLTTLVGRTPHANRTPGRIHQNCWMVAATPSSLFDGATQSAAASASLGALPTMTPIPAHRIMPMSL